MPSIQQLQSITLDLPPSCIEFCPNDPQYAVVGTYNLEKEGNQPSEEDEQPKSQQRNGSLILIKVIGDEVYAILEQCQDWLMFLTS
jgi:diphthamide biosynthesis protein 7